jgi:hypothetical protein
MTAADRSPWIVNSSSARAIGYEQDQTVLLGATAFTTTITLICDRAPWSLMAWRSPLNATPLPIRMSVAATGPDNDPSCCRRAALNVSIYPATIGAFAVMARIRLPRPPATSRAGPPRAWSRTRLRIVPAPRPALERRRQMLLPRLGQVQLLDPTVGCGRLDPHVLCKCVDGQRFPSFELRQNRELSRAQPDRCQELIIKLSNVPSCGSDGEAVAIL